MSNPKSTTPEEIGVRFNKWTGGPYADMREVIESELARGKEKYAKRRRAHNPTELNKNDDGNSNN